MSTTCRNACKSRETRSKLLGRRAGVAWTILEGLPALSSSLDSTDSHGTSDDSSL
jgi:hypothetical protein